MSDREILDKYIDLDNYCLTKQEKKEVRKLILKYKEAFTFVTAVDPPMHTDGFPDICWYYS